MKKLLFIVVLIIATITNANAKSNEAQAHDILLKTLNMLQNPGGAQLSYDLKVSFYHKSGWILLKGEKFKRSSRRTIDWYNGQTFWSMSKKTNEVTIKKPKHKMDEDVAVTSQLNFIKSGCRYSMTTEGDNYKIFVNAEAKDTKIKKAIVLINRFTYAPVQIKLKVGFIWATINMKNFKTGNYANSNFNFDPAEYKGCTIIDKR